MMMLLQVDTISYFYEAHSINLFSLAKEKFKNYMHSHNILLIKPFFELIINKFASYRIMILNILIMKIINIILFSLLILFCRLYLSYSF
jgi:hypothetical protein